MKKKILIPVCIILAAFLALMGVLRYAEERYTLGISVGRVLHANNSVMLICENSPIVLSNISNNEKMFEKLSDGDKILVFHDGVEESYPAKTGSYAVFKLSEGSIDDISSDVLTQLSQLGWITRAEKNN